MYNQNRKPAPVVKCPHCDHIGSSRGLFTHVRLSHPNVSAKPKIATKITAHPYDIKGMGHVKETIHRIETSRKKPIKTDWQSEFFVKIVAEVLSQLANKYGLKTINTSERGYKSTFAINGVPKKRKRIPLE